MVQTSIYIARGFLIESKKPTWYAVSNFVSSAVARQSETKEVDIKGFTWTASASTPCSISIISTRQQTHFAGMVRDRIAILPTDPTTASAFCCRCWPLPWGSRFTPVRPETEFSGCDESWSVIMTGSGGTYSSRVQAFILYVINWDAAGCCSSHLHPTS